VHGISSEPLKYISKISFNVDQPEWGERNRKEQDPLNGRAYTLREKRDDPPYFSASTPLEKGEGEVFLSSKRKKKAGGPLKRHRL